MSDPNNERDLKSAIRELAAALESGLDDHPSSEKLQSFVAGHLPGAERARLQEHLALCQGCARVVKELRAREQGDLLTASELDREWHRFQAAAGISRRKPTIITALAAVLLLTILGITVWWGLQEVLPSRKSAVVADLFPAGEEVRSPKDSTLLPSEAGRIVLRLNLVPETYPEYDVEILTMDGQQVWSQRGVPRLEGTSVVIAPARLFSEGIYQIRLSGPQGQSVAEYLIEIDRASGR